MITSSKITVCLIVALFLVNPVLAGSCTKCGGGGGNITATIDVNWTFTGAPGTAALVTNIGNNTVAKLNFLIPAGVNGTNGVNGANGAQGLQGVNGTPGDPGPAGANGSNGTNGTNGTSAYVYGSPGEVLYNIGGNSTTNSCMKFDNVTGGFYSCSVSGDGGNLTNITASNANRLLFQVREGGGSALKKGMAVYVSGGTVGVPYVRNASNVNAASSRVVGLVYADINMNAAGRVIRYGTLDNVDTRSTNTAINPNGETWAAGDLLFLANSVGGGMTNVRPISGRTVKAAYALSPSSAAGSLLVYPMENPVWVTAASNEGIVLRLGDSVGATNVSIRNYANTQVAWINSTGGSSFTNYDASQDADVLLQADSHIASNKSQILSAVSQNETLLQSIANDSAWDKGYTVPVMFLTQSWTNSTINYFGSIPAVTTTIAGQRRIYITKAGNITGAEIWVQSGTAGSDQPWTMDISKNGDLGNSTTLGNVTTVGTPLSRRWSANTTFRLRVVRGDYIEIKTAFNLFPVKPATSIGGGYVYIE